jgi:energy-converting hydrogenase Eha subunit A
MTDTVATLRPVARAESRYFYFTMALCFAAVAFIGFAPTYWAPMAKGTFRAAPVLHLHGLIFFSWTLYFIFQTWLVAAGQTVRHRSVGLIGISLATAMTFFGILIAILSVRRDAAAGLGEAARTFMIVPLTDIALFAIFVLLAMVYLRRAEWHKRFMLLAMIVLMPAPIARWFLTFLAPPGGPVVPPVSVATGPVAVASLLLIVAMLHDWRSRGRPHAVYVWGGGAFLAVMLLRIPFSTSPAWQQIASALAGLGG